MSFRDWLLDHRHVLATGFSLMLFLVALVVLHRELASIHLVDVRAALGHVPPSALVLALVCTFGSYLALSGYDVLALRHLGRHLPYWRVGLISFFATTVGHNMGMAILSAGAVRLRLYTAAGLTATEVGGVVALVGLTFGMGITFVAGLVLLVIPLQVAPVLHVSAELAYAMGLLAISLVGGYFGLALTRRRQIKFGNWKVHVPAAKLVIYQLLLAVMDLIFAATALYLLIPADYSVTYPLFLGIFVLAVIAGIVSHIPAGLGVFETVMLIALPDVPRDVLLAAILAYRGIYYLLPLALAVVLTALAARMAAQLMAEYSALWPETTSEHIKHIFEDGGRWLIPGCILRQYR